MPDFLHAIQSGNTSLWLFIPSAILLGALHGLEPGHSKTMMAAFIIAIRGTVAQAVLLGLSAAISHTAVVWVVALGGQYLGHGVDGEGGGAVSAGGLRHHRCRRRSLDDLAHPARSVA